MRRAPVASLALAWTLLTSLPSSNILPLTHLFIAERYLYVPSFGVCLLAALLLERSLVLAAEGERPGLLRATLALAALLIVAGGVRSALRNQDWRDDESLWSASLRDGVEDGRIQGNLGVALMGAGRLEDPSHTRRALELHPCTRWQLPLANALYRSGRLEPAARQCSAVLKRP